MRTLCVGIIMSVIPPPAQSRRSAPPKCPRPDGSTPRQPRSRSKARPRSMWPQAARRDAHHRTAPAARTRGGPSDAGRTSFPSFARRRHSESRFARSPYLSATPRTVAPGSRVSATICALSSSGHRRRPAVELSPPHDRKNSTVSSTEKLLPCSKTGTESQKSWIRRRWAPDRSYGNANET